MGFIVALLEQAKYSNAGADRLYRVAKLFLDVAKAVTSLSQSRQGASSTKRKRVTRSYDQRDIIRASGEAVESQQPMTRGINQLESDQVENTSGFLPWQVHFAEPGHSSNDQVHSSGSGGNAASYDAYFTPVQDTSVQHPTDLDWVMWDQLAGWPGAIDDQFLGL